MERLASAAGRPERGAVRGRIRRLAWPTRVFAADLGGSGRAAAASGTLARGAAAAAVRAGQRGGRRSTPPSGRGGRICGPRALQPLLSYLRELGAVPPATAVVPQEPVDALLARFGGWLSRERGLAPATVSSYLYQARPFAAACAGQPGVLTAARVSGLAAEGAAGLRPRSAQVRANVVRALLRFAWLEGLTAVPLAGFVGSFVAPAGAAVPKGLSPGQAADACGTSR